MKVLVVEDEKDLLESIKISLQKENYLVEQADDFFTAYEKIGVYEYDCILLDITLPNGSGLTLLESLKEQDKAGNVIIISAKDSLDDKIRGLELGADDYLTKPFHIAELNARIKAVLRRKNQDGKNQILIENTVLDLTNRKLLINENEITLNRKEFDILYYFMVNKDRLVTKSAIAEHVWGDDIDQIDSFDFIYSQIKNIRKKLTLNKSSIEIEAVYGIGYTLASK